jgi:hypothetical protein
MTLRSVEAWRVEVYLKLLAAADKSGLSVLPCPRVTVAGDPDVDVIKDRYARAYYAHQMTQVDNQRGISGDVAPVAAIRTLRRRVVITDRAVGA